MRKTEGKRATERHPGTPKRPIPSQDIPARQPGPFAFLHLVSATMASVSLAQGRKRTDV
jgi:hypothetical protein